MIDNLNLIKSLLNFSEEGDFYMLYVMKRKKDQPIGMRENHQSVRIIKSYCVDSIQYLERRYEEVKQLCEMFKARAYIHVQKQNHKDVSLNMLVSLAERIKNGNHNQKNLFESIVGKLKVKEKRWIVDIDSKEDQLQSLVCDKINLLRPKGIKVEAIIPSRAGYHLICKKFDLLEFKKIFPNIDVQKSNPSLLYYPDSLD